MRSLGWQVRVVPSQELIHLLGAEGFQRWLLTCVESWRPDVLLCHPPYDHLSLPCAARIKEQGTRLVAFDFDAPLVFPAWSAAGCLAEVVAEMDQLFDLYASTSEDAVARARACGARGFRFCRWAMSSAPFTAADRNEPAQAGGRALSAGSAYPERVELLSAVARAGVPLRVHGSSWQEHAGRLPGALLGGRLARADWLAHTRQAAAVIAADGWEGQGYGQVKARLLEVALMGSYQLCADSPDLAHYFPEAEVGRFTDAASLVAGLREARAAPDVYRQRALQARERAQTEHSWRQRWPELLEALAEVGRPLPPPRPAPQVAGDSWACLLSAVAHGAEADERHGLAHACQLELLRAQPNAAGALAGAGRAAFALGRNHEAAVHLQNALRELPSAQARHGRESYLRLQGGGPARGMGVARLLCQAPELSALRLVALLRAERLADARRLVANLDCPDMLVTVAGLVQAEGSAEQREVYRALFTRALAARPVRQQQLQRQQSARWSEA